MQSYTSSTRQPSCAEPTQRELGGARLFPLQKPSRATDVTRNEQVQVTSKMIGDAVSSSVPRAHAMNVLPGPGYKYLVRPAYHGLVPARHGK